MRIEAEEHIRQHYDHVKGNEELTVLLARTRGSSSHSLL